MSLSGNDALNHYDILGQRWFSCFGSCVEEWRFDWGALIRDVSIISIANLPVSKTKIESLWFEEGVAKNTTLISRGLSKLDQILIKLPLGHPVRTRLVKLVKDTRHIFRNPIAVGAGYVGAVLTVFEGFYNIGVMTYCSIHCCGK